MSVNTRDAMRSIRNHLVDTMLDCGNGDKFSQALHDVGVHDIGDLICMTNDYMDDMYVKKFVNGQVVSTPMDDEDKELVLKFLNWLHIKAKNIKNKLVDDEWLALDAKEFYASIGKSYPVSKPQVIVTIPDLTSFSDTSTTANKEETTTVEPKLEDSLEVNKEVETVIQEAQNKEDYEINFKLSSSFEISELSNLNLVTLEGELVTSSVADTLVS